MRVFKKWSLEFSVEQLPVDYRFEWCHSLLYHLHKLPDEDDYVPGAARWESTASVQKKLLTNFLGEKLRYSGNQRVL